MTAYPRMRLVVPLVVALFGSISAQQPARNGAAATKTRIGTGLIAGLVTLGDDARTPVRRAVVTLTAADHSETLAAISGDDGRFAIERVPAGRFTLEASKPAHLGVAYGARRVGRPGTVLIVTEGQRLTDLTLSLPRGAVLAGRVTFPNGHPVPNVQMMAVPSRLATAGGTPVARTREFRTDDLGEFRLFGLLPDTYLVAALPSFGRDEVERMPEGAGAATTVQYAPTYFPGTPSVGDAMRLTVAPGQVRDDLHFTITAFPAATIRGRVIGTDGSPAQASAVSLEAVGPTFPVGAGPLSPVVGPNRNGEFHINGVSPGLYRLRARAAAQTQIAVTEVTVSGENIDGLVLALQEGHRLTGTLTTDGSAAPPSWTGVSVIVQPITAAPTNTMTGILTPGVPRREATVDDTGRFAVTGLEPFDYEVLVTLPAAIAGQGWRLDTIRRAGRDIRDEPLTFAAGSVDGVEVRLTTSVTELSGRLTSETGTPTTDYFIIAFPAERSLWHAASPRVRVMRPAADGTFSTRDLPAGTYRVAALVDVDDHEPTQREFLESIYAASIEVALAPGKTTQQEIRVRR